MRYAYLIIRITLFPFALMLLIGFALSASLIWAFHCDYDHDAILKTHKESIEWMRTFLREPR